MIKSGAQQNILIYRLGSLGDTVVALPALRLVAKAFPHATRLMLTNFSVSSKAAPIAEILENTGLVSGYLEYPLKLRSPLALLALRNRIRAQSVDAVVYLTAPRGRLKAFRDALFFRACGIKKLIGVPYGTSQQNRQAFGNGLYEYEGARLLRCLESLGSQSLDEPDAFDLALTSPEHEAAEARLKPLGNVPILAVSVGAKADVKDWGDENWRALIQQMAGTMPGWALIMLGAQVERDRSANLAALWQGPVLNLCGEISVRGSAAILSRAKLYLGHDSGPMHLAAAVGTHCVAIFSSQNLPGEWFPYGKHQKILYHPIDCQGCRLTICVEKDKICIRSISVAEAHKAVISSIEQLTSLEN